MRAILASYALFVVLVAGATAQTRFQVPSAGAGALTKVDTIAAESEQHNFLAYSPTEKVSFTPPEGDLPARFDGHDIVQVYETISAQFGAKDEFETSAAFEKRISSAIPTDVFAFVRELPGEPPFALRYDADRGVLEITDILSTRMIYPPSPSHALGSYMHFAVFRRDSLGSLQYEGSNAYGAKATVSFESANEFGIIASNAFGPDYYSPIGFRLSPDVARAAKERADRALYICQLERIRDYPIAFECRFGSSPTITLPRERSYKEFGLSTRVNEVWLFNSTTGEVLARMHREPAKRHR